jgi:Cu(I)/Ag(I) efflux system membrane fusion protein
MNSTRMTPTSSPPSRPSRGRFVLLLLLIGAGGLYAGARWHDRLAPLLGLKVHSTRDTKTSSEPGVDGPKQLWTCGMHPQVIQDNPGDCPICHMKLTPMKVDGATSGHAHGEMMRETDLPALSDAGIVIDPSVVQNMGVRVAKVEVGPLRRSVRLFGYIDEAQPNIRDVNLRVSGWIQRVHVEAEGDLVREGDPLFDLYSPELRLAVEELIAARRARLGATDEPSRESAALLQSAAADKLELLGLDRRRIESLSRLERAPAVITFTSPWSGHVTRKNIVEGSRVEAGQDVLRIVDHSTLWLDALVFEKDLPLARPGNEAEVFVAARPGEVLKGKITFIHPHLDPMTRTTTVRLEIPNPALTLRPGMYAVVTMEAVLNERTILVPREAIIDTGDTQVVFVPQGAGRYTPRRVRMGPSGQNGLVQVFEGLSPDDSVVVSGQFLIDSESRFREAIRKFLGRHDAPPGAVHGASQTTGATRIPVVDVLPEQQAAIDAFFAEYLRLSEILGATQKDEKSIDTSALLRAADALQKAFVGGRGQSLVESVASTAAMMRAKPIDAQREAFGWLSEAVVALAASTPPSAGVAETLYVMNCPMTPHGKGDWLQTTPQVANPYFATEMKRCGTMVRSIPTKRPAQ